MKLHSINTESRLYNIRCGEGFTCIGFDVAERRRLAVLNWIRMPVKTYILGTEEHFRAYEAAMEYGAKHAAATGCKCPADLTPDLKGLERKRVEVTLPDGSKSRFYVGTSSGWMPCHLEIKTTRSLDGTAVYYPPGSTVRVIR